MVVGTPVGSASPWAVIPATWGSDSADHTTDIQAILNVRQNVIFPPGTFNISAALIEKFTGRIVRGVDSRHTIINQLTATEHGVTWVSDAVSDPQIGAGIYATSWRDMTIAGPGSFNGGTGVFSSSIADGIHMDNATVFSDGVTNSTNTFTSATAAFVAGDVGYGLQCVGVPPNTVIVSVTNGTTVILSKAATASASGLSFSVSSRNTHFGDEHYFYDLHINGFARLMRIAGNGNVVIESCGLEYGGTGLSIGGNGGNSIRAIGLVTSNLDTYNVDVGQACVNIYLGLADTNVATVGSCTQINVQTGATAIVDGANFEQCTVGGNVANIAGTATIVNCYLNRGSGADNPALIVNGSVTLILTPLSAYTVPAVSTTTQITNTSVYRINTFSPGDDFTGVGAASNASGVTFTATGNLTRGTSTWTHGSVITQSLVVGHIMEVRADRIIIPAGGAGGGAGSSSPGLLIHANSLDWFLRTSQAENNDIALFSSTNNRLMINEAGKLLVGTGKLNLAGIPTSSAGLVTGDVWSNAGILSVV